MSYYEIGRQVILSDAFEAMTRNNSQYGILPKDQDYDYWIQREIDYHNKRVCWIQESTMLKIRQRPESKGDYALLYCCDGGHIEGNYLV